MRRRRAGHALLAIGTACIVALHVQHAVWADVAPWQHRLSEYANGRAGVLMTVAFSCFGAALVVLAPLVRQRQRVSTLAVLVAGVGLLASGIFRTGVTEAGATSDALHGVASSVATVAMIAAVVWSRRWLVASFVVALGAASPITHGTVVAGLNQRLLWGTLLVWCFVATRNRPGVSGPSARSRTIVA